MRLPFLNPLLHRPPHTTATTTTTKTSSPRCPSPFANLPSSSSLLLLLLTLLLCAVAPVHLVDSRTTLECHIRNYSYRVTKPPIVDSNGDLLTCSAIIEVSSCWGRCDSSEIGDYKMPYRISNHPVCTYTGRASRRVTLPGCGNYPNPTVDVFDATGCSCRVCDSDYTSCENLNG